MDGTRRRKTIGRLRDKVAIAGLVESGDRQRLTVMTDLLADQSFEEAVELLGRLGNFKRQSAAFLEATTVTAVRPATGGTPAT